MTTFKSNQGWEYEKKSITQNDQISENINDTIEQWKEEGYELWKDKDLKPLLQSHLRYITKIKDKIMARKGGILIQINPDYVLLKNLTYNRSWSVQLNSISNDGITGFYYHKEKFENKQNRKTKPIKSLIEKKDDKKEEKKNDEINISDDKEKDKILNQIYYEEKFYVGRDKLFNLIKSRKINGISSNYIGKWLKKQNSYQLTTRTKKQKGVSPVVSKGKFRICEVDLFEINKKPYLSFIDTFTKYGMVYKLKNKSSIEVANKFYLIHQHIKSLKFEIKSILSDNGKEFTRNFSQYLKNQKIKQIFGLPHTPTTQGIIERFNGTIKNMIYRHLNENNSKNITQSLLNKITNNYNQTHHKTIEKSPLEALTSEVNEIKQNIIKNNNVNMKELDDLKIGDKIRLQEIDGIKKKTGKNWNEEIFEILRVVKPRKPYGRIKYKIRDMNGEEIKGYLNREQLLKYYED